MDGNYLAIKQILQDRLREPAPARIQMLTGPRQVGKTTILLDILQEYGDDALYLAGDAPESALLEWWLAHWGRALRMAQSRKSVLLVDEVHAIPNWSRLIKAGIDEVYRLRLPLHVVISGSAALPLAGGARETMAGRFERLTIRHWAPRDLIDVFSLTEEQAVEMYVRFGAFPGGIAWLNDQFRWKTYVREAITDPAIGRDLLMLESVEKPALLRQIFAVCIGHPSEIVALKKIAGYLLESGNLTTIAHYLDLLNDAYLVAALPKYSAAEIRRRAAPPKLIPLSNAFLAVASEDDPPTRATDTRRWGHWLENACIARAVNAGYRVSYWREEPHEIDMVIEGAAGKWAVEVKGGEFTACELTGLLIFCSRNPEFRPLVIGEQLYRDAAMKTAVDFITWQQYLLDGLPRE